MSFISQAYEDKVARNRAVIRSLVDIVLVRARRGFPLRGHLWDRAEHTEDGNFAYLVRWAATKDDVLHSHLVNAPRNASYLSPTTQNEIIECIESDIREQIVAQCVESMFMSVMADETTDCGATEQLSICVRYVNQTSSGKSEVCEDFLGFAELKEANAETITDTILITRMSKWGADLSKLRGKGFDGASTMSGHISGVQARITENLLHARYFTHCSSHCLNLVVVHCCRVPMIRNFMDSFQRLSYFIRGSAKRKSIQQHIFEESSQESFEYNDAECVNYALRHGHGRQVLPSLCETRWLSRVDAVSTLLSRFSEVFQLFQRFRNLEVLLL